MNFITNYAKLCLGGNIMYKKYCDKLISLTSYSSEQYEILYALSAKNKENTSEYTETLEKLYDTILVSFAFCQKIPIDILRKMTLYLNELIRKYPDDNSYNIAYDTAAVTLDKMNIALRNNHKDESQADSYQELYEEESFDDYEDSEEYEDIPLEQTYQEDYPDELDDIYDEALGAIYASATRIVFTRIINMPTTNKYELNYKKRLLKEYNTYYKYSFLSMNAYLEILAIKARFNPFKLYLVTDTEVSSIYYNEALSLSQALFTRKKTNTNVEDVLEDMFDLTCFEQMLSYLNIDQIQKLKDYTESLSKINKSGNYGEECLSKIKKLLK